MRVIGIDPGMAITGYGIIEETPSGDLQVITFGAIRTPVGETPDKRLLSLFQQLGLQLLQHKPDCGAVEKLFFQKNTATAMAVGQARGVAILAMAQAGILVGEYTPLEVKMAVTGFGKAQKNQVQQMVGILLGLKTLPKPDDAADALAVAVCHLHSRRMRSMFVDAGAG